MSEPLLALRNVETYYGPVLAIQGVSLDVPAASVVALLGSNGAGKSTVLKSISGFVEPRKGTIAFAGRSLVGIEPDATVALGVSHVPEGREVFPFLSVRDNLLMGAYMRRDRDAVHADMERMVGLFPILRERAMQPAAGLSGGEQQMLAIARALVRDPKIVLLDEPFEGLAPVIVHDLVRACHDLAKAGQTIVLVEQNLAATLALADRVYIINNGYIAHEGTAAELKAQPEILQRYLGV